MFNNVWGIILSCMVMVMVEDILLLMVVCQNVILVLDVVGLVILVIVDVDDNFVDDCGIVFYSFDVNSIVFMFDFDCEDVGISFIVMFYVIDQYGNMGNCIVIVIIQFDIEQLSLICLVNINVLMDVGYCGVIIFWVMFVVMDNCDGFLIVI